MKVVQCIEKVSFANALALFCLYAVEKDIMNDDDEPRFETIELQTQAGRTSSFLLFFK